MASAGNLKEARLRMDKAWLTAHPFPADPRVILGDYFETLATKNDNLLKERQTAGLSWMRAHPWPAKPTKENIKELGEELPDTLLKFAL